MNKLKSIGLLLLPLLLTGAAAEPPDDGAEGRRCLPLNSIQRMTILDNRHIVFDTRNRQHYLNTLPYPCPGLRRGRAIMYRTSLSRLCDLDIITVLDDVGPGYRPQGSCGLGTFVPIGEAEFQRLKQRPRNPPE